MILAATETYPDIPVALHQDHGNSPETCISAIELGFTSVMMDGSLGEDAAVAGVGSLAAAYPVPAGVVAGIIMLTGFVVLWFALSRARRCWQALRRWLARDTAPGTA